MRLRTERLAQPVARLQIRGGLDPGGLTPAEKHHRAVDHGVRADEPAPDRRRAAVAGEGEQRQFVVGRGPADAGGVPVVSEGERHRPVADPSFRDHGDALAEHVGEDGIRQFEMGDRGRHGRSRRLLGRIGQASVRRSFRSGWSLGRVLVLRAALVGAGLGGAGLRSAGHRPVQVGRPTGPAESGQTLGQPARHRGGLLSADAVAASGRTHEGVLCRHPEGVPHRARGRGQLAAQCCRLDEGLRRSNGGAEVLGNTFDARKLLCLRAVSERLEPA